MKNVLVRGRRFLLVATLATCAGAMTISACDDDDNANDALESGALTVSVAPSEVTVPAGSTATMDVTITRSGEFNGPVTLKAGGEPDNVDVSFSPEELDAGVTSATVTVTVTDGAVSGSYPITVAAIGSLVRTGQQQVTVVVEPAPAPPPAVR